MKQTTKICNDDNNYYVKESKLQSRSLCRIKKKLVNKKMNKKTNERPVFPFTSIVGQEEMFDFLKRKNIGLK